MQDAGGTDACVDRGTAAVADLRESAAAQGTDGATATADEQTATLGDLTVGVVVDDLADSTRRHADRLLDAAGRPARATRIGTEAAARGFDAATGFLGNAPVTGVAAYGQRVDETDAADAAAGAVTLLDAPSRVEEAATGLAAAGAHLVLHVTGQGTPAGHPIVPVVKLSGDADTLAAVPDDIDLDARETDADDLEAYLLAVADGDRTCAERHGLTEFSIARAGPST
ncbi:UxaA family hydrolase [Haloferax volcanii]|uniref:UxaA family hydrolase n=1 Tax=Haloferax volcanii TaxID=2246 RepID=UPI002811EE21|nr:UxaA family hydrolase [Haloferax volcanii]